MLERGQAIARPFVATSHVDATYTRYKWAALLGVSFCYLFYYTGRQTFGFAIPGIQKELGLSKEMLGWVSASMLWAYALGQSINGNLGDKWGGRAMMLAGAILSFAANWTTSFATSFVGLLLAWGLNGYFQAMGFAPGSRLLSNWWGHKHRGFVYSFYVGMSGFSSVLAYFLPIIILGALGLDWRWIFRNGLRILDWLVRSTKNHRRKWIPGSLIPAPVERATALSCRTGVFTPQACRLDSRTPHDTRCLFGSPCIFSVRTGSLDPQLSIRPGSQWRCRSEWRSAPQRTAGSPISCFGPGDILRSFPIWFWPQPSR